MGASILVIDDDAIVRETVQYILESVGYEVTCAENGERGLEAFRARRPDVVVTDIIMPDREGIGMIIEMRREWPGGPIVAISGGGRLANADYLKMAGKLGANSILAKPFEPEDLIEAVGRCLRGQRTAVARIEDSEE
jgi:DNA-binding NtrC family response regulator